MDPNQPSNQMNSAGPRRSVDGVRRTSGPVAQPRPVAPAAAPAAAPGATTASQPPKTSRRQAKKATKQANKAAKKANKQAAKQAKRQPVALPVAQPAMDPIPAKSSSGLKVFFQTVLAIVVILAVAMTIVVLYVRYYQ